jgi:hypothetical protein
MIVHKAPSFFCADLYEVCDSVGNWYKRISVWNVIKMSTVIELPEDTKTFIFI